MSSVHYDGSWHRPYSLGGPGHLSGAAEAIFISEGTLKQHLHNIYGKLDVKNRSGAMTRARALGIL